MINVADTVIPQKCTQQFAEAMLDGELVLMNVDTGRFSALKNTGLAIWQLIDSAFDVATIKRQLIDQYAVSVEGCDAEVANFLSQLETAGFVILD